jgi:hypothetical protein
MPIRQYFAWVGSVLLVALFVLDQWFPAAPAASHYAVPLNEIVNLRVRSDHKWPERVVFDTRQEGMSLAEAVEPESEAVPGENLARQRKPLDAFAALNTTAATNDSGPAIRATPQPRGPRISIIVQPD